MTCHERPEHLKIPGQFLSPRFKPHITLLATYQYTFPNTIYLASPFTTSLFYHNSPTLDVTTPAAAYGRQNAFVESEETKTKGGPPRGCPEISIQGLEPADDSIDSDNPEYECQSQDSQESQEGTEFEQHWDDED